jgi:hypothetical protein
LCLGRLYSLAVLQLAQDFVLRFGSLRPPPLHSLMELRLQLLPRWRAQLQELRKKHSGRLLRRLQEPQPRRWPQFAEQKQARLLPLLRRLLQLGLEPLLLLLMQ